MAYTTHHDLTENNTYKEEMSETKISYDRHPLLAHDTRSGVFPSISQAYSYQHHEDTPLPSTSLASSHPPKNTTSLDTATSANPSKTKRNNSCHPELPRRILIREKHSYDKKIFHFIQYDRLGFKHELIFSETNSPNIWHTNTQAI